MRKRVVLIITLILIVTIVLISSIIPKEKNQFKILTIKNISSIKIVPATTSGIMIIGKKEEEFPFDLSKKAHQAMANNILSWLKSGRMMRYDNNEAVSNGGGGPTYLVIELKNGTSIFIKSAFSMRYVNTSNGKVTQQNTDGQVTISTTNPQEVIRELSPKLKSFLDNGWKSFFNYNNK
ncbi:hypothetical protein [Clostridium estertheticum]|uniref:hypothetical protein n=1 Tax=Clostridium estertheticum TaxID=238834 RepID=UPI001C6E1E9A|nr:hypothetical protein [Clostridium estertheticum]MBW9154807.1 hypothetical protein [Clostridium estertheticum]WLC86465.1 hypothetical protein KTC97_21515 [Clostridium estertheticum]